MLFGRAGSSRPGVIALGLVPLRAGLLIVAGSTDALQAGLAMIIGLGHDVVAEPGWPHVADLADRISRQDLGPDL